MGATSVLEFPNSVKKPPVSSKMKMVIEADHVLNLKQRIKNHDIKKLNKRKSFA